IIQGIVGDKGRVHVAFGDVIDQDFDSPDALAEAIDRQIHLNYKLFPINKLAAGDEQVDDEVKAQLKTKLEQLPEAAQPYLIASYA
ncbi:acyltransferase, partial [Vibrio xuii]